MPRFMREQTGSELRLWDKVLCALIMVIIPVASLEQHGLHLPIGTDYLNGVERAKRIAQEVDVLLLDVAHADSDVVEEAVKELRRHHEKIPLVVGNVATAAAASVKVMAATRSITQNMATAPIP